jgi:hypothetical protein
VVEQLQAKGVKFKRDKAGLPTEVHFAPDAPVTVDDWRAIGELKSLTRGWTSVSEKGGGVPLNDDTAKSIAGLENMQDFFSNGAQLTDDGFAAFAGWRSLKRFGLDHWFGPPGNKEPLGKGLAHLKDLPNLEHVRLGGCRVGNAAPEALAQCKSLQSVDLFHTFAVTDDGVAFLTALPNLKRIVLGPQFTARITDATLAHLGKIKTLEEIHVTETWLTYDNGFTHLKGLQNLKVVKIPNVLATEADVAKLKSDHPGATIEWTMPTPEQVERLKAAFERAKAGRGGKN